MKIISIFIAAIWLCFSTASANSDLAVYELPAFYNFQKKFSKDPDSSRRLKLNPIVIPLAEYKDIVRLGTDSRIQITALKGETVYKGILLHNNLPSAELSIELAFSAESSVLSEANAEINLVSTWFQAGRYTTFTKGQQYLTHELLLKSDIDVSFDDNWVLEKTKWYYEAPEVSRAAAVTSRIVQGDNRRLLIELNIPENINAGNYQFDLEITDRHTGLSVRRLGFDVEVVDVSLTAKLKDKYNLFIYTMLALDPNVGTVNTYINGQNNRGEFSYQKKIYRSNIEDIADKGFNGVIITDWRPEYTDIVLSTIKDVGLDDVIIYGNSPIGKGQRVVSQPLVDVITAQGFTPTFYGYDEPGGNKKRAEQLAFNKKVHSLNSKSMNAMFWDDLPKVEAAIRDTKEDFDYLTISMGSHGNRDFLNSLPLEKANKSVKYLAYWHPHVENPIRNKLFMGYWLWASGLDGISPHAYSIKPHVSQRGAKFRDDGRGRLSPYNDFSMWDNAKSLFRQHATVYPEKNGVISTLQWEAVADGVTDLILVNQLESLVATRGDTPQRERALALLAEIKSRALVKNSSAISVADTNRYMLLMKKWKAEIKQLIVEYSA